MWQLFMFSVGVSQLQSVGVVWRRLHNGELSNLYCSKVLWIWFNEGRRKNRWRWAFGKFGVRREGNRIVVLIREWKKQPGIFRHRSKDDIDGAVKNKGWSGYVEWICLSEDRDKWWAVVGTLMNICVSKCVAKFVIAEKISVLRISLHAFLQFFLNIHPPLRVHSL